MARRLVSIHSADPGKMDDEEQPFLGSDQPMDEKYTKASKGIGERFHIYFNSTHYGRLIILMMVLLLGFTVVLIKYVLTHATPLCK